MRDVLDEDERVAVRVFKQIWQVGVTDVALLQIRKDVKRRLGVVATISPLRPESERTSRDGTRKWLWRLPDGERIESVLIPDDDHPGRRRLTLCISSQVGCAMACTFCVTGDLGLRRHLTAGEIAGQVREVQTLTGQRVTNLVLMGMGEPLHNLAEVITALRICLDDDALGLSHRRVTVSTVGLVPKMHELAAALPVNLAVSLNATTEALRREIMPITKRYSMAELLDACRTLKMPHGKRITFEYVLLAGKNDSPADAERLHALLQGIRAKVNLIAYNENPGRELRRPEDDVVRAFQHSLVSRGVQCSVRTTRGRDVSAACGQLAAAADAPGYQAIRPPC